MKENGENETTNDKGNRRVRRKMKKRQAIKEE
jgi:hypothetical protein